MTRVIGIDPGINGALALHRVGASVQLPEGLIDLPTVGEGNKRELAYAAIRDALWRLRPDVVFLEYVTAMPSIPDEKTGERRDMGATSAFRFGGGFFAIKAVVACLDIPMQVVTAQKWKKHYRLPGGKGAKEAARKLAIERCPSLQVALKRVKDHQRAEAYLIAAYGGSVMAGGDATGGSDEIDDALDEVFADRSAVEDVPE